MTTSQLLREAGRLVFYCHTHPKCTMCDQLADVFPINSKDFTMCLLNSPCYWHLAADNVLISDKDAMKYYKDLCQYCIMLRSASDVDDPCTECIFCEGAEGTCKVGYPYCNEPRDKAWLASGEVEVEGGDEIELE